MRFFESIGKEIENMLKVFKEGAASEQVNLLVATFSIILVVLIMIKGYQILAGKAREPMQEIIWDISIKAIIMMFVLNIDGWLDLVIEAMEGFDDWAGGGIEMYKKLDLTFNFTRILANITYAKAKGFFGSLEAWLSMGLIYVGFATVAIPALIIIITTSLTLKILIMIAPIMIFMLAFGWLKNMFTQWLMLVFSNTLTVLFVGLFFEAINNYLLKFIILVNKQLSTKEIEPIMVGVLMIFYCSLLAALIKAATGLAREVASVSLDQTLNSGIGEKLGLMGAGAGAAMGAGKAMITSRAAKWAGGKLLKGAGKGIVNTAKIFKNMRNK